MKKWFVIFGIVIILMLGLWFWVSVSDSGAARMFSGALKETVKAESYAIPASGTNLRAYEWTTKSGMKCVGVYSIKGGGWGDCEFPPNGN